MTLSAEPVIDCAEQFHAKTSRVISQTTSFWEFRLGLLEVKVILRGKLGFYGRSEVLEKRSWRSGVQPEDKLMYVLQL